MELCKMARGSLLVLALLITPWAALSSNSDVFFAINCGGDKLVDKELGIEYSSDLDDEEKATPPGISARVPIKITRAPDTYQPLFQTERYALESFGYEIPTPPDGDYTLVLRFSEVYWQHSEGKVFGVKLDGSISVLDKLDIFKSAGFGAAHDEFVEFKIQDSTLEVKGKTTKKVGDSFSVDFVKGSHDNPKINAILIVKGSKSDAEKLCPLEAAPERTLEEIDDTDIYGDDDEDDEEEEPEDEEDYVNTETDPKETKSKEDESNGSWPFISIFFAILAIFGIGKIRESLN